MGLVNTFNFITSHPLNKNNKLKAIYKFLRWQFASRFIAATIVYDWIGGTKFFVKNGDSGLTGNIYTGLHEFVEMSLMLHFLVEGDLFIDVGSNVGSYTILAAGVRKARVYAFEPVPQTFIKLIENIRLNHIEHRVNAYNIGLGDGEKSLRFTTNIDCMNYVINEEGSNLDTIAINTSTLDSALGKESPALIKIDVEGFEKFVLVGAELALKNPSLKIVILEVNEGGRRYGYGDHEIFALMDCNGFKSYSYNAFTRSLLPINSKNSESANAIFIRDLSFVLDRIKKSDIVEVNGYLI